MADDESACTISAWSCCTTRASATPPTRAPSPHVGEAGVIDVVGLLGYYSLLAMVMNTARTALREDMNAVLDRVSVLTPGPAAG